MLSLATVNARTQLRLGGAGERSKTMDLGKQVRVVEIPQRAPASRPVEKPERRHDEELIPLPDNWPKRSPVRVPEKVQGYGER